MDTSSSGWEPGYSRSSSIIRRRGSNRRTTSRRFTDERVLLIEDDVVSGISLDLVMKEIAEHEPSSVSLYLGRQKDSQQLHNIPSQIDRVDLAEDGLDPASRGRYESEYVDFF